MFTGRLDDALATLRDEDGRPPGVPDEDVDGVALVAQALKTRAAADIARATQVQMAMAPRATGWAENAIGFLSGMGDQDHAFAVAEALYFSRGFEVSTMRYSAVERVRTAREARDTRILFLPWAKGLRRDPRFAALVEETGLAACWRAIGVKPDYQIGKDI